MNPPDATAGADGSEDGGGDSSAVDASGPAPPPRVAPPPCAADITAQVLANSNVTLAGDSCVVLAPGTTQYDGILSGVGTLTVSAPNGPGTLVVTGDSTFTLPPSQQTETAKKTANYYAIENPNPPAVYVEPNVTLQLGTITSTTGSIASYLPNTGTAMINADNIQVDGILAMGGGPTEHFGVLSGAGTITQPGNPGPYAPGTFFLVGDDTFSGLLSILSGGYVGDLGIEFSMPFAQSSTGAATDTIVDNGTLVVDNTTTPISLSNISGTGAVVQLGAAATTLLANSYSGGTTISGGSLVVGSDTSLGTGNVANSATVTTASTQHVIHVGGNYQQGSTATLAISLGGTVQGTSYDYLAVTGKASLDGMLVVGAAAGFAPSAGTQFIVVVATGGVSGTFRAVSSTAIKLAASYDATHAYLTVTP